MGNLSGLANLIRHKFIYDKKLPPTQRVHTDLCGTLWQRYPTLASHRTVFSAGKD